MIVDPQTGLITRMEQFDEDDVDRAVARFDELITERGQVLHNEASIRAGLVNAWIRRGDGDPTPPSSTRPASRSSWRRWRGAR